MAYSLMMTSFDNSAVVGPHVKSVTKRASYGGETLGEIHRMRRFWIKFPGLARRRCERGGLRGFRIRGARRARVAGPRRARAPKPKPTLRGLRLSAPGFVGGFRKRARAPRWRRQASAPARRAADPNCTPHTHVVPCQFRCATGTYIHHPFFIDELELRRGAAASADATRAPAWRRAFRSGFRAAPFRPRRGPRFRGVSNLCTVQFVGAVRRNGGTERVRRAWQRRLRARARARAAPAPAAAAAGAAAAAACACRHGGLRHTTRARRGGRTARAGNIHRLGGGGTRLLHTRRSPGGAVCPHSLSRVRRRAPQGAHAV